MNAEFEKNLGQRIRSFRIRRHMTQEAVAAQLQLGGCDITRSAFAKIEAGQRHIYPDELKLLTQILKVSYEDLLDT